MFNMKKQTNKQIPRWRAVRAFWRVLSVELVQGHAGVGRVCAAGVQLLLSCVIGLGRVHVLVHHHDLLCAHGSTAVLWCRGGEQREKNKDHAEELRCHPAQHAEVYTEEVLLDFLALTQFISELPVEMLTVRMSKYAQSCLSHI